MDNFNEDEERVKGLRPSREKKTPVWMNEYVSGEGISEDKGHMALMVSTDPLSYEEVVKSENWRLAMDDEIKSIQKNQTWRSTKLLDGVKSIGVKWVYKTKYNKNGNIDIQGPIGC